MRSNKPVAPSKGMTEQEIKDLWTALNRKPPGQIVGIDSKRALSSDPEAAQRNRRSR